jgi:hypothetical protein
VEGFQAYFDHPEFYYGSRRALRGLHVNLGQRPVRERFRHWCEHTGKDFEGWKIRARRIARRRNFDLELFESQWFPGGYHAYMANMNKYMIYKIFYK